jgi:hypothetical protein
MGHSLPIHLAPVPANVRLDLEGKKLVGGSCAAALAIQT